MIDGSDGFVRVARRDNTPSPTNRRSLLYPSSYAVGDLNRSKEYSESPGWTGLLRLPRPLAGLDCHTVVYIQAVNHVKVLECFRC